MKFGCLTNPSIDILEEIKTIGNLGFDFVEIAMEEPLGMPEILLENKKQISKLLDRYQLFALAHAPWWAELGTLFERIRKAWIDEAKDFIMCAQKLDIEKLNFHLHSRGLVLKNEKSKKQVLNNYISSLNGIAKFGRKHNVKIILENPTVKGEIVEFESFRYIVNNVEDIFVNIDIGHAFLHGGMKNVVNYIRTFGDILEHVHVHDNNGKRDEHLPIGKGKIDYKRVVRELKKIDYDKTITFEVFSKNTNLVKDSMNKIKKLWQR